MSVGNAFGNWLENKKKQLHISAVRTLELFVVGKAEPQLQGIAIRAHVHVTIAAGLVERWAQRDLLVRLREEHWLAVPGLDDLRRLLGRLGHAALQRAEPKWEARIGGVEIGERELRLVGKVLYLEWLDLKEGLLIGVAENGDWTGRGLDGVYEIDTQKNANFTQTLYTFLKQ